MRIVNRENFNCCHFKRFRAIFNVKIQRAVCPAGGIDL